MKKIKDASNTPIVNDRECPLLTITQHIKAINTNAILSAVSIVHECTDDCKIMSTRKTIVERENVTIPDGYHVEHDYSNDFFCLNVSIPIRTNVYHVILYHYSVVYHAQCSTKFQCTQ